MEKATEEYYKNQCSSGIVQCGSGFSGHRYHIGNGWFGEILKHLKPALHYIGKQGWNALKSMGSDVMRGDTIGEAGRKSLITTTQNVLNDATTKLEEMKKLKKQVGKGIKRKRRSKNQTKKRVKTIKKKKKSSRKLNKVKKGKKVYKKRSKTKKISKKLSDFFK